MGQYSTQNRSLFREVNERIREVNEAFGLGPSSYELVCECAHCDCMQRLQIPGEVYEKVRATADRYLVAPGHERGDRIVTGAGDYSVVTVVAEPPRQALPATG
ncbi:MAG: hypothetical protein M3R39_09315 [Actinomycetota bacterium]|nr:hypothetical protein [Actinomycetota bacterium]